MGWFRSNRSAAPAASSGATSPSSPSSPEERTSLRTKFLLMLLPATLIGLGIITFFASQTGKKAMTEAAFNQLTSYRAAKKQQVERYFRDMRDTFAVLGTDPAMVLAFKELKAAHATLGASPVSAERRQKLEAYYQEHVLPKLADDKGEVPPIEGYWPGLESAVELQSLYITENRFKVGEKMKLVVHPVENAYTAAHGKYHAWLRDIVEKHKYSDLFMIDGASTIAIYTAFKEPELGTSLAFGPYAKTALGGLVRSVAKDQKKGSVRFADYEFHPPSGNAPAAFMAVPIYDGWQFLGVLAAQISTSAIDDFMNNHRSWREQGLGETGSAYLAGMDRKMRSNAREMIERPEEYLGKLGVSGFPTQLIERIRRHATTILNYEVNAEPVLEAAKGKSGTMSLVSRKGGNVLISYAPVDIPDLSWVVLARMDENEVLASQKEFNRRVLTVACTLGFLTTIAGLWMARNFMRPLTALMDGIHRLQRGERDVSIAVKSKDEFGELIDAFNAMSAGIKARDEVIEGKNRAYAQLLKRIFPDTVADKLKQGEANIAESFNQVTVIYAIVEGLADAAHEMGSENATRILNDLVDAFDNAADRTGIEKVKTIGDHYLAVCGLDVARLDHAKRSLDFAKAIHRVIALANQTHNFDLQLRVGLATGPVQAGLVGNRRFVYDIWGPAASIARRIVYEADLDAARMSADTYGAIADKSGIGELSETKTKALGVLKTYQYRFRSSDVAGEADAVASAPKAAE